MVSSSRATRPAAARSIGRPALAIFALLLALGSVLGPIVVEPPARLLLTGPALFVLGGLGLRLALANRATSSASLLQFSLLFSLPLSAGAATLAGVLAGSPALGQALLAIASSAVVIARSIGPRAVVIRGGCRWGRHLALSAGIAGAISLPVLLDSNARYFFSGQLHGSIVQWATIGPIPPDNPQVAGQPLHFYWFTHVMAALLCRDGLVNPLNALALLNAWALAMTIALLLRLSSTIGLGKHRFAVLAWTFLTLNAVGGWRVLASGLEEFYRASGTEAIGLLSSTDSTEKLAGFLNKYVQVNGFPQGILGTVASLSFAWRFARSPRALHAWSLALSIALTFLLHPTSGLAAVGASAVLAVTFCPSAGRIAACALCVSAGCLAAAPYLVSITGSGDQPGLAMQWNGRLLAGTLHVHALAIPFALLALATGSRRLAAVKGAAAIAVAWLVLVAIVSLPDGNQYKFARLLSIPIAILGVAGTLSLGPRLGAACRSLVPILGLPTALLLLSYRPVHDSLAPRPERLRLEGIYTVIESAALSIGGAIDWMREHSSPRAVCIAEGAQRIPFFAGRRSLTTRDAYLTFRLDPAELALRRDWMRALFEQARIPPMLHPLLAQRKAQGAFDECYLLVLEGRPYSESLRLGNDTVRIPATLVFQDACARLYRLEVD